MKTEESIVSEKGAAISDGLVQATVLGITVLLGFTLNFILGWATGPNPWHETDKFPGIILIGGLVSLVAALNRSLSPSHLYAGPHRETVRFMMRGILLVIVGIGVDLGIRF